MRNEAEVEVSFTGVAKHVLASAGVGQHFDMPSECGALDYDVQVVLMDIEVGLMLTPQSEARDIGCKHYGIIATVNAESTIMNLSKVFTPSLN